MPDKGPCRVPDTVQGVTTVAHRKDQPARERVVLRPLEHVSGSTRVPGAAHERTKVVHPTADVPKKASPLLNDPWVPRPLRLVTPCLQSLVAQQWRHYVPLSYAHPLVV